MSWLCPKCGNITYTKFNCSYCGESRRLDNINLLGSSSRPRYEQREKVYIERKEEYHHKCPRCKVNNIYWLQESGMWYCDVCGYKRYDKAKKNYKDEKIKEEIEYNKKEKKFNKNSFIIAIIITLIIYFLLNFNKSPFLPIEQIIYFLVGVGFVLLLIFRKKIRKYFNF